MKLSTKLLMLILISSLIPLTIISIISFELMKQTLTETTFTNLNTLAESEETRIENVMEADFGIVDSITSRTALRDNIQQYNESPNSQTQQKVFEIISDARNSVENLSKIQIYGLSGNMIAETDNHIQISDIMPLQKAQGQPRYVDFIRDNDGSTLKVFVSDIMLEDSKIGTAMIYFNPERLFSGQYEGFGDTGELLLGRINNDGNIEIVASRNGNLEPIDSKTLIPMTDALKGIETQSEGTDYKGDKVFAITKQIEKTGWGLVVKINKSEALGILENLRLVVIGTIGVSVMIALTVAIFTTNSFSRPINSLREYARKIADGKYNETIKPTKIEELEALRQDIDYMKTKLKEREDEYKKENELKDQFINIAAHELKSPIQPIINYAKLAIRGWADKDQSLRVISEEGNRLQKLTNNILDVSRIKSGTYKYKIKETKLVKLLQQVISEFKKTADSDITIKTDFADEIIIKGDEEKLFQVFENVIGNAVKFTNKGTIYVKTSNDKKHKSVVITVEDSAGGIPEEILPKLFEKFSTKSVNNSTVEGTGLGLFLSKTIVDAHHGTIRGFNNEHGGATFVITLPIM